MNWKERLNIENAVITSEIDTYLKGYGFYESKLSPRFFNEESFVEYIIENDAACLRLDTDDPSDDSNTMRIFINSKESYMEVQNNYRNYERSFHIEFDADEELTISYIDYILSEITSK